MLINFYSYIFIYNVMLSKAALIRYTISVEQFIVVV